MLSTKITNTLNLASLKNIDMSQVLNDGAEIVRKDIRGRYDKSIDVDGAALTPLKPGTIESKKRRGYKNPTKPLIAKGKLAGNQLIKRATRASQRAVVYISQAGSFYKGTPADKIYGYHHTGAPPLPARRPFGLSDEARGKIAKAFHLRINRIVRNLGR